MHGELAQEAVQGEHGEGGGLGLEAGKGTRGRENPAIHAVPIVQQIADGYLQFFDSPSSVTPFITGAKTAGSDLWHITVPPTSPLPLSPPSALFTLQALPSARFVAYWHRAFGSPSISTFIRALTRGFIRNIPALTAALVRKFPPPSLSTSFGHLNTLRRGIASTRLKLSPTAVALGSSSPPVSSASSSASRVLRASARLASPIPSGATKAFTVYRDQWTAAELTGRNPVPSHNSYEYILVVTHHGYIRYVPMKSRHAASYVRVFKSVLQFFASFAHPLTFLVLDNETSAELTALFRNQQPPLPFQHVPPLVHRANKAERCTNS